MRLRLSIIPHRRPPLLHTSHAAPRGGPAALVEEALAAIVEEGGGGGALRGAAAEVFVLMRALSRAAETSFSVGFVAFATIVLAVL